MLVECTQCHRSAMVCDCPANPAGTADRITELERQLAEAHKELSSEREKVREAREGLKRLEWSMTDGSDEETLCPSCGQFNPEVPHSKWADDLHGHEPDCWLSALIAKLEAKG
jgi:hypothetical protein